MGALGVVPLKPRPSVPQNFLTGRLGARATVYLVMQVFTGNMNLGDLKAASAINQNKTDFFAPFKPLLIFHLQNTMPLCKIYLNRLHERKVMLDTEIGHHVTV